MTLPEQWKRIHELLDELLDLEPDAAAARLSEVARTDAELADAVRDLLSEDGRTSGGLLDRPLDSMVGGLLDGDDVDEAEPPTHLVGQTIGPYRILGPLGRGGMGEVLLAERADGDFDHRVALKIVRGGLDRGDVADRFRHERQILAKLTHPNIAVLHDGGTTPEGVPWFAMEYVEGERITDWCDRHCLDVDDRLKLFDGVCDAVAYAHRNLVIHRDIKPSNVFVTESGEVKLLDFGIAKVLDSDAEATASVHRYLTPAYAAPEQVSGGHTSTGTDIYSLGVLLYQLLSGHHPHGDTSRSVEIARAIVEDDPPDPSTVAARDLGTRTANEVAACRGVAPEALRRKLRGDLDNIVRRALRKNPEARYASVADLREDLRRHRESLPVSARPATVRYRVRKFVRRHRLGASAAVAVAVALVLGFAGVAWQARIASQERDRATAEAARAEAVKDYLLEVFAAADPVVESGASLTALELAERGAQRLETRFQDEPEIRAELTQVLGVVLTRFGQFDRADSLLTYALDQHRRLGREDAWYDTLIELGSNARWRGDLELAATRFREAADHLDVSPTTTDARAANALGQYGLVLAMQAQLAEADSVTRAAEQIARRTESPLLAELLSNRAYIAQELSEMEEAERLYVEALEEHRRLVPEGDVAMARTLISLGDLDLEMRRGELSEQRNREALVILRREFGDAGHPDIATVLNNIVAAIQTSGAPGDQMGLLEEALAIYRKHLGTDKHRLIAGTLGNMAVAHYYAGDLEAAAATMDECIVSMRGALGDDHPDLITPMMNRGVMLSNQGRLQESEAQYHEALAVAEKALGPDHHDLVMLLGNLAFVQSKLDKLDEAEANNRRAMAVAAQAFGPNHFAELEARLKTAKLVAKRGRLAEAKAMQEQAIADARLDLAETWRALALALRDRSELGEALGEPLAKRETMLTEAYDLYREHLGDEARQVVQTREELEALRGRIARP